MPLVDPNLESRKHMRVVDLDFVYDFQQTIECIAKEVEIQDLTHLDDFDQPLNPPTGFRVIVESIDHLAYDLKSTLVNVEVKSRYLLAKEKLMKFLKLITLEDHQWYLGH